MPKALVMGASGFLGSHVVKELVAAGREVRIMVRASSDTRAIDHLGLERVIGDLDDRQTLASAMAGCDTVFYCIVDTRAWLRDPAPLYRTNVHGLRTALDLALQLPLRRFVFTSTFATIGLNPSGVSTEADLFNWWGRPGERYIVAERWVSYRELFTLAAARAGVAPPRKKIPLLLLYAMAGSADLASFFTRRDNRFSIASLRCSTMLPNVDSSRARTELGWQPTPIEQSVVEAVDYYLAHP